MSETFLQTQLSAWKQLAFRHSLNCLGLCKIVLTWLWLVDFDLFYLAIENTWWYLLSASPFFKVLPWGSKNDLAAMASSMVSRTGCWSLYVTVTALAASSAWRWVSVVNKPNDIKKEVMDGHWGKKKSAEIEFTGHKSCYQPERWLVLYPKGTIRLATIFKTTLLHMLLSFQFCEEADYESSCFIMNQSNKYHSNCG